MKPLWRSAPGEEEREEDSDRQQQRRAGHWPEWLARHERSCSLAVVFLPNTTLTDQNTPIIYLFFLIIIF